MALSWPTYLQTQRPGETITFWKRSKRGLCCVALKSNRSALGRASLHAKSLDDPLAAQRLLEREHFDLIFLDVEMPGQTGLELCVKIRGMEPNRTTPIVFVTSHSDFGSRAQSTLSGGNDFIAKPFLLVELALKTLTRLFKEGPQPLPIASVQSAVPTKAGGHESQLAAGHGAPKVRRRSPAR